MSPNLPIWRIQSSILEALRSRNRLVLAAPTGSGKTTQVPQMILDAGLAGGGKIVVLQPRRVAARTVAARVAWERRVQLGTEVGYQVRFDDTSSPGTRIAFVTEGILLRWLQDAPSLPDVSTIIFDEFHERNLLSDAALALAKKLQRGPRPDLKIAVMSATLEVDPIASYLSDEVPCPVLVSEGQTFPVEVRYADYADRSLDTMSIHDRAAEVVEQILNSGDEGDILVFMPGMSEINATIRAIRAGRTSEKFLTIPLHGDLPPEDQDAAFQPSSIRKIVVATNVAETSVTIDGIRHVVDSGLARVARYDPERGIQTLALEEISRDSAEQRKGRAGRTAPGVCHRLWTESGHLNRPERNTPEIRRADLAEVVLLLHSLGIRHAAEFDWLDRPDRTAVTRAEDLLRSLGALRSNSDKSSDETSDLTPVGRQMLRLPMHPRYARMLLEASRRQCLPAATLCAALISGRDLLTRLGRDDAHVKEARELFEASRLSDFHTLMRAFQFARNCGFSVDRCRRFGINAATAQQVEQTLEQFRAITRQQGLEKETTPESGPTAEPTDESLHRSILAGFVDQLCARRQPGTLDVEMTEGRTAKLMRESMVQDSNLFVAAVTREVNLRDSGPTTLVGLATAVKREWVLEVAGDQCQKRLEHLYDRHHKRVAAVSIERFRDLVIAHQHQAEVDPRASGECLANAFLRHEFELPLLDHSLKQLITRVNLVRRAMPELEFPVLDEAGLRSVLARAFHGLTLAKQAQSAPLEASFHEFLGNAYLALLVEIAPLAIAWPGEKRVKLAYPGPVDDATPNEMLPELQVKLVECFSQKEHPRICEGRVPVRLLLHTPDGKRLDTTTDWPTFRVVQYTKIRGTLAKKFPGNIWP